MENRTNQQWVRAFGDYLKRRYPERSTAKHYTNDVDIFLNWYQGRVLDVTASDVDEFVQAQHSQRRAVTTVNRRVAALKTFFEFVAQELSQPDRANPVSSRRHAARPPKYLPRDLSDEEVARLLAVVEQPRDQALIGLMLYAGLRVGEVVTLRAMDTSIPPETEAPLRLRVMGKGRKERVVYLKRNAADALLRYMAEQVSADGQQPLFRNRLGQPMSIAGLQERVGHYATLSGVPVTCHRLRHTYARWLAEGEMPVLALARLMGHAQLQSTQRYIDGADPQVRRAYQAAMERAVSVTVTVEPIPVVAAPAAEVATPGVQRAEPTAFDGTRWHPEWPKWLRQGCLAWLQHQWWQWKASQRAHHAKVRLSQWHIFWSWQLSHRPVEGWAGLHTADVAAFVDAQLARGLKAKTVRSILDGVYAVLRYLVTQGQLATVPALPPIALPEPLPRHLAPHELIALETFVSQQQATADDDRWLDIGLYYMLAHGGLRISEVLDLQVQDVDLVIRRVRVRDGKGHRDRVVCLTPTAATAVQAYLNTVPHAPTDLLFSSRQRPVSYAQALKRIQRLGEAAGVPQVSPIRLRHTYATTLLNNGMTIDALRRLMGHEHLSTTLIYARLADVTVEQQYQAAMARVAT